MDNQGSNAPAGMPPPVPPVTSSAAVTSSLSGSTISAVSSASKMTSSTSASSTTSYTARPSSSAATAAATVVNRLSSNSIGGGGGVSSGGTTVSGIAASGSTTAAGSMAAGEISKMNSRQNMRRKDSKWEILTSLEHGTTYSIKPKPLEGYLAKRRKFPLKGWHKRYFVLNEGFLTYGKSQPDMVQRGRTHGRIDVGTAVISAKTEHLRIDIDDVEFIHHLKASNMETFGLWLEQLQQHRFYQQNILNAEVESEVSEVSGGNDVITSPRSAGFNDVIISPKGSLTRGLRGPGAQDSKSLKELSRMDDRITEQLVSIQRHANTLGLLAQKIEDEVNFGGQAMTSNSTGSSSTSTKQRLFGFRRRRHQQSSSAAIPSSSSPGNTMQKQHHHHQLPSPDQEATPTGENSEENSSCDGGQSRPASMDQAAAAAAQAIAASMAAAGCVQGMAAPAALNSNKPPLSGKQSLTSTLSFNDAHPPPPPLSSTSTLCNQPSLGAALGGPTRDELIQISQDLQSEISQLLRNYSADKDRLKSTFEQEIFMQQQQSKGGTLGPPTSGHVSMINALRSSLNTAMQQNAQLKEKLGRIHAESAPSDLPSMPMGTDSLLRGATVVAAAAATGNYAGMFNSALPMGTLTQGCSFSSDAMSGAENYEFFDAREYTTDKDDSDPSDDTDDEDDEDEDGDLVKKDMNNGEAIGDDDDDDDDLPTDDSDTENDDEYMEANDTGVIDPSAAADSSAAAGGEQAAAAAESPGGGQQLIQLPSSKNASMRRRILGTGRRTRLPAMAPTTTGLNLWNLLCKNIGKDLSKISMPVTLNEPLSVLQRLCEELEYSELLDRAAASVFDMERMMWVAAFAVSAYGYCNDRAGHKPFNPLLGETYECIREDKGFRYVAEQVSHHPPITACHATSTSGRWSWWQDFRVKTKFWGKSMEFQPEGMISVELELKDLEWNEVYTWNKVTTCIHNLFGSADRWADLYGECVIKCRRKYKTPDGVSGEQVAPSSVKKEKPLSTCNLEFVSASGYWSNNTRHEVRGSIKDSSGKIVQNVFGKCTEALYCGEGRSVRCIWRPGTLPEDNAAYYGFSRFAIELNELLAHERGFLPPTDTRFRPDQRCLEEGKIAEAESLKLKLEQAQRERRQENETANRVHESKWFRKASGNGEGCGDDNSAASSSSQRNKAGEQWVFDHNYWDLRKDPGFYPGNQQDDDEEESGGGFVKLW